MSYDLVAMGGLWPAFSVRAGLDLGLQRMLFRRAAWGLLKPSKEVEQLEQEGEAAVLL